MSKASRGEPGGRVSLEHTMKCKKLRKKPLPILGQVCVIFFSVLEFMLHRAESFVCILPFCTPSAHRNAWQSAGTHSGKRRKEQLNGCGQGKWYMGMFHPEVSMSRVNVEVTGHFLEGNCHYLPDVSFPVLYVPVVPSHSSLLRLTVLSANTMSLMFQPLLKSILWKKRWQSGAVSFISLPT